MLDWFLNLRTLHPSLQKRKNWFKNTYALKIASKLFKSTSQRPSGSLPQQFFLAFFFSFFKNDFLPFGPPGVKKINPFLIWWFPQIRLVLHWLPHYYPPDLQLPSPLRSSSKIIQDMHIVALCEINHNFRLIEIKSNEVVSLNKNYYKSFMQETGRKLYTKYREIKCS